MGVAEVRNWIWNAFKWFLFKLDAEFAHRCTVAMIRLGIRLGGWPLQIASGGAVRTLPAAQLPRVFGMEFQGRVGLAAGFDKDAEIVSALPVLGFGFAEIGTVTPRPQPGNDRPRLFRDPQREAVFNRMGFNGLGATLVSQRLAKIKPNLPPSFRVGVNIGKNKDTPLEKAAEDYALAAKSFQDLADYMVINVSSPNTPGLRSLQTLDSLRPIVERVNHLIIGWSKRPPLLLKLAPELQIEALKELMGAAESWGIDGWVLTNTLAGTWKTDAKTLEGGWSGGPLKDVSHRSLVSARQLTRLPIISVGGITSVQEAQRRISSGADLIQIYSGWIYRGPTFPNEINFQITQKTADLGSKTRKP